VASSQSPDEWYRSHWQELKEYVGEWVAYSKDGVVAHDYLRYASRTRLPHHDFSS
jgi:Family of unknown function (DUF5678)